MEDLYRRFAAPFVGACLLLPLAARTADMPPLLSEVGTLEEVIVTAEKRESRLQETPISISVLDAGDLANRHAQSLEDLGDGSIPSLRVAPFFARSSALTIGMRGIGAMGDANQPSRDQGVGVYVDGVYLGRAQGLGTALYDVEHIEVLKGPQGTLFGRNTEGGAVNIVTKRPTGEFGLVTTLGVGDHASHRDEIHLNLPSLNGLAVKVDGLLGRRGGTVRNPLDGQPDFNSYDKRGLRVEGLLRPTDDFSASYAFDHSYDGTTPFYVQLLGPGALARAPILKLQLDRAEQANVGVPMQPSVGVTHGHLLTLDWQASSTLQLKSLSSYRTLTQSQYDPGTNLSVYAPNAAFSRYSLAHFEQSQYSQEFQFIGTLPRLQYAAGAFYYHERVRDDAQTPNTLQFNADGSAYTVLSLPPLTTISRDRESTAVTASTGLFGQATWTATDDGKLRLTAGGRFTRDHKRGSLLQVNGALPVVCDAARNCVTGAVPLDHTWSRFDPMVNVAYAFTGDLNVYAKWSTGYKAGGANSRSLTYRAFDPESVSAIELGLKSEFLDRRLRFNVAAFDGSYKDVQIDFNAIIPGNNRGTLETTNTAGTGTTRGVEVEVALAPTAGLTLSANYAYTNVELPKAPNPFAAGNPLVTVYPLYTPKSAGSLSIDYRLPVSDMAVLMHLDANYSGAYQTSSSDLTLSDTSTVLNGRVALADMSVGTQGGRLQVALWSRNLLNEAHVFLRNFNASLGTYGIYNEPRSVGVELNLHL